MHTYKTGPKDQESFGKFLRDVYSGKYKHGEIVSIDFETKGQAGGFIALLRKLIEEVENGG